METNNMLNAETITTAQIRALRSEAEKASDYLQVDICDLALSSENDDKDYEVGSGELRTYMTPREARAECARVISDAAAQE